MRKVHFTTPEQAADYLRKSLDVVANCDVPEDLREAAFNAVFTQIAGAQVFMDQSDANGGVNPAGALAGSLLRQ